MQRHISIDESGGYLKSQSRRPRWQGGLQVLSARACTGDRCNLHSSLVGGICGYDVTQQASPTDGIVKFGKSKLDGCGINCNTMRLVSFILLLGDGSCESSMQCVPASSGVVQSSMQAMQVRDHPHGVHCGGGAGNSVQATRARAVYESNFHQVCSFRNPFHFDTWEYCEQCVHTSLPHLCPCIHHGCSAAATWHEKAVVHVW